MSRNQGGKYSETRGKRKRSKRRDNQVHPDNPEISPADNADDIFSEQTETSNDSEDKTIEDETDFVKADVADDKEEEPKKKGLITGCVSFLKSRGYWTPLITTIIFFSHFIAVLSVLFGGAVVFAHLEDFRSDEVDLANDTYPNWSLPGHQADVHTNISHRLDIDELFWFTIQHKYNITVNANAREMLIQQFSDFLDDQKKREDQAEYRRLHSDKMFVYRKWFYFVTIVATTIGYGDVTPKTDKGRLFYMFFSIIGIILMMTLLRRCGTVISFTNRKVYGLMNRYLCKKGKEVLSGEVLSLISILLIFVCYVIAGTWYEDVMLSKDWSVVDTAYFWIVTFTTVGFGDLIHTLEQENENMHFYIVYRIFGLAFLAAIIDAIQKCIHPDKIRANRERLRTKLQEMKTDALVRAPLSIPILGAVVKE